MLVRSAGSWCSPPRSPSLWRCGSDDRSLADAQLLLEPLELLVDGVGNFLPIRRHAPALELSELRLELGLGQAVVERRVDLRESVGLGTRLIDLRLHAPKILEGAAAGTAPGRERIARALLGALHLVGDG